MVLTPNGRTWTALANSLNPENFNRQTSGTNSNSDIEEVF